MPVPWFSTHCGGNQHVSFTLDLWWWSGRKLMGRTPAWKINCAYVVSANGEVLHWEPGAFALRKWGRFYLISAKQQHMLSIFFLQIFCLGRDGVGKRSDVAVEIYIYFCISIFSVEIYIYTYVCVCGYICWWNFRWADGLCHRWEQKHSCQPLFGRRDTADLCCTMSFTEFSFSTARTVICKSALPVAA